MNIERGVYMRQFVVNGELYTAVRINVEILLREDGFAALYANFCHAKKDGTFDGDFNQYCEFCSATAVGLYLRDASRIRDISKRAVKVFEKNISDNGGEEVFLYGN